MLVEESVTEAAIPSKKLPNLDDSNNTKLSGSDKNRSKAVNGTTTGASSGSAHSASGAETSAELPRLVGTKSQASTASSSATRDSGISVNDVQKAAEQVQMRRTAKNGAAHSVNGIKGHGRTHGGSSKSMSRMISVDDLPISGRAMPLGKRPSTNRSTISNYELSSELGKIHLT